MRTPAREPAPGRWVSPSLRPKSERTGHHTRTIVRPPGGTLVDRFFEASVVESGATTNAAVASSERSKRLFPARVGRPHRLQFGTP